MSRDSTELPERLIAGGASDFERRVIDSALEKRPSAAASARMARALGVTVTALGTAATARALAADATSKATSVAAASTASTAWPWLSIGVLGLVVAGVAVGVRARHGATAVAARTSPAAVVAAPVTPVPTSDAPAPASAGDRVSNLTVRSERPLRHGQVIAPSGDLRDEIALVDSARAALSAGDGRRALEIVRRYEAKYATGTFRPEVSAVKIEALLKLGRVAEARGLATRFVTEQHGTLLAERVAELLAATESVTGP
jgi:hypothetical protein